MGTQRFYFAADDECCDQPGCPNKAVARFEVDKLTADDGSWLDPKDKYGRYYRKFCLEHIKRGDCDREDCDSNYAPLDDKKPEDSTNTETSPSQFGGVIEITEIHDKKGGYRHYRPTRLVG